MPSKPVTSIIMPKNEKPVIKVPVYEPNIKEPSCRAELLKYWIDLSLDEKTAQKRLWISEGGAKVACINEEIVCPYLDRPERYEYSPQVLCKEGIWGMRAYWEVEFSGWVNIGATCEGSGRKAKDGPCGLGENDKSWSLGWFGSSYQVWHDGAHVNILGPPHCPVIGVYVDQPEGIVSFYTVDSGEGGANGGAGVMVKEATLLHRFQGSITERVLPGFWVGVHSSCMLLKKTE